MCCRNKFKSAKTYTQVGSFWTVFASSLQSFGRNWEKHVSSNPNRSRDINWHGGGISFWVVTHWLTSDFRCWARWLRTRWLRTRSRWHLSHLSRTYSRFKLRCKNFVYVCPYLIDFMCVLTWLTSGERGNCLNFRGSGCRHGARWRLFLLLMLIYVFGWHVLWYVFFRLVFSAVFAATSSWGNVRIHSQPVRGVRMFIMINVHQTRLGSTQIFFNVV